MKIYYTLSDSLTHHGIKGQKWGYRRYQNADGTLTDEGRRRYGFGSGRKGLITQNTKAAMKKGTKIGAGIGAGIGVALGATTVGALTAAGGPIGLAVAAGAGHIASMTAAGAIDGLRWGAIIGAGETALGRSYIKRFDKGIESFEKREAKK